MPRPGSICGGASLCSSAHCVIFFLPKIIMSSSSASVSSLELKSGKRFVRKASRMMPADHMSSAGAGTRQREAIA